MFKRKIRLFFVNYGKLLFYIIGVIAIFFIFLNALNNYAARKNRKAAQEKAVQQEINIKKRSDLEKENIKKGYILAFINHCMNGNIQEAYNMLTENCKTEKYKTLSEFKSNYVDTIFNVKIDEYKIENENEVYTISLIEDMLVTGKTKSTKQTKIKLDGKKIDIYN